MPRKPKGPLAIGSYTHPPAPTTETPDTAPGPYYVTAYDVASLMHVAPVVAGGGWRGYTRPDGSRDPCVHRAHSGSDVPGGYLPGLGKWLCDDHMPPTAKAECMTHRQADRVSRAWARWERDTTPPKCVGCGDKLPWFFAGKPLPRCATCAAAKDDTPAPVVKAARVNGKLARTRAGRATRRSKSIVS